MTISSRSSAAVIGSLRIPKSSMMSSGTVVNDSMNSLRVPSATASARSSSNTCVSRYNTRWPCWIVACPTACARWLFPVPPGPRNRASSRFPMKAQVARSKTRLRFIFGLKLKSKLSRVLCGSRKAARLRRLSSKRHVEGRVGRDCRSSSARSIGRASGRCRMGSSRFLKKRCRRQATPLMRAESPCNVDAQVDADCINEHWRGWPQDGKLLSQGATKVVCLVMKLVYDDRRIEVVLILQERTWALDLDSPGRGRGGWEMPLVIGHDHSRPGLHSGGQHMTILGIVGH